jgi:lipoprotein-anchoring transpeptidase ErfK/SrfK
MIAGRAHLGDRVIRERDFLEHGIDPALGNETDCSNSGKYLHPAWTPPAEIKHDKPNLPDVIPGGSGRNPMGAAALTLSQGEYAIHGTNDPASIGGFVSYGCIRMYNADILDLYGRFGFGTPVVVTR